VVTRDSQDLVPAFAQPLEEAARVLELLCPRALGEVAADDDKIGLQPVDAGLNGFNQILVMGAEMQVRKVDEASHDA
jgi:hypothetical protein